MLLSQITLPKEYTVGINSWDLDSILARMYPVISVFNFHALKCVFYWFQYQICKYNFRNSHIFFLIY